MFYLHFCGADEYYIFEKTENMDLISYLNACCSNEIQFTKKKKCFLYLTGMAKSTKKKRKYAIFQFYGTVFLDCALTRVKYDSLEMPKKNLQFFFRIFIHFIFGKDEMIDLRLTFNAETHNL